MKKKRCLIERNAHTYTKIIKKGRKQKKPVRSRFLRKSVLPFSFALHILFRFSLFAAIVFLAEFHREGRHAQHEIKVRRKKHNGKTELPLFVFLFLSTGARTCCEVVREQ